MRPTTTSCVTSPEIKESPGQHDAVDPMLQRDALQEADVAHQLYNPAIPQNPPPESMDMDEAQPQALMQAQTPGLPREDESLSGSQGGMMGGAVVNNSNAFEGALDGTNFVGLGGLGGLEPFSMDSSSWYTGDWLDPDPSRHGGML